MMGDGVGSTARRNNRALVCVRNTPRHCVLYCNYHSQTECPLMLTRHSLKLRKKRCRSAGFQIVGSRPTFYFRKEWRHRETVWMISKVWLHRLCVNSF